jgi:sterol 3beta-glucosyltransferase
MEKLNIGIFTYGTRGDVQPYIALGLGLVKQGHDVTLAAPKNFESLVTSYRLKFHPLHGDAEQMMNSEEGKSVVKSENSIKLMKYFFKVLHEIRVPLRKSYAEGINKVDFIIANSATLPIVWSLAEKLGKKVALSYFMPPVVPTGEFPLGDFDFLNFPFYNKLTYKLAHSFYWSFVKAETNEFRKELGLPILKENLIPYIGKSKPLDLYCISPSLIPQPKDWPENHKITGFLSTTNEVEPINEKLNNWLKKGKKPIYIGFGSNGVGNTNLVSSIIEAILTKTDERVLFCTGWSVFEDLPEHENLFVTKYVNHDLVLPQCKIGVFHGGAGTLASMLRNDLPVIIISFYTDQPTWGKIVEKKKLGVHIPFKKLNTRNILDGIKVAQSTEIKESVIEMGKKIRSENGLENAIQEIEKYFSKE